MSWMLFGQLVLFVEETKKLTEKRGVQLILDGVGRTTFPGNMEVISKFGHIVIFGSASGPAEPIAPSSLMAKSLSISGGTLFDYAATRADIARRSADVLEAISRKWLKLRIETEIPLQDAAKAHRILENRETIGKVVLSVINN